MSLIPKSHLFKVMRCFLLGHRSVPKANEGQLHRTWKTFPRQCWGAGVGVGVGGWRTAGHQRKGENGSILLISGEAGTLWVSLAARSLLVQAHGDGDSGHSCSHMGTTHCL